MSAEASPSTPPSVTKPLTTIYDLPVEILLHIFTFNTRHNFDHIHDPSRTTRHTSQVCKQWRYISLNCPALWAQSIDFKDPLIWLKKVTTRCGTLPIDMIIPSITNSLIKSCADKGSAENLHRTSPRPVDLVRRWDLPMSYDAKILAPWFFHLPECRSVALKIPAAVWKTFKLDKMDLSHLDSLTVVEAGPSLEPRFLRLWSPASFIAETPWNLRSLTLSGCITAFNPHAFRRLSELTVHNVPSFISLSPSSWLDVLSNIPSLKHLELINATITMAYYEVDEPEVFSYHRTSTSLPQLERLHLEAPLHHCSYIFDHLKFPSSCNITVAACAFSSINTPFHFLIAAIDQHFYCHSSKKASGSRSLLAAVTPSTCVINLTGPKNLREAQNSNGSLSFSVRWNNNSTHPALDVPIDPLDIFSALTSAIGKPCATVTNLNLVVAITVDNNKKHHEVLDTFLSSFDRLETIEHISSSTLQFLLPFFNFRRGLRPLENCYLLFGLSHSWMLPIITTATEHADKSTSGSGTGRTPITDMRFRFCHAVGEKAVKNFERFGVSVLRDGMTFGYVSPTKEKK